ncbi:MAG: hypothetical protein C4K47_05175 [Candidatus Thorarchaeota archaeon]|nr:MAG: hypothetical protein C4K47_05175 [Candidatus Thorarchaeota archaeon]
MHDVTFVMFLQSPLALLLLTAGLVLKKRSKKPTKAPYEKQIRSMITAIDKGKTVTAPATDSRLEIITDLFESKMKAVGLEPSQDSGYVPTGFTPLATFLHEHGASEDIVGAMLSGLKEANSESEVLDMIDAAAESKEIDLRGSTLAKAKELAMLEWKRSGHDTS